MCIACVLMACKIYLWWIKSIMTVWRHIDKGRTFQRCEVKIPSRLTSTCKLPWDDRDNIHKCNILMRDNADHYGEHFLLQRDAGFFYSHFVSLTPGTRNSYYGTTRNKATQVRDQHLWSYFSQDIFLLKVNDVVVCELGMRVSESPEHYLGVL